MERNRLLDIHTHLVDGELRRDAVASLSLTPGSLPMIEEALKRTDQAYSLGIHPWDTASYDPKLQEILEKLTESRNVVAIGECGFDPGKGAPMYRQIEIFRMQVLLAERLCKPMVIHDVKAHDMVVSFRNEVRPAQDWIIHGFRGKPTVAAMLLKAGCCLSYGERFNPESLLATPFDRLFAETDESRLSIEAIIGRLSEAMREDEKERLREKPLEDIIAANILSVGIEFNVC